MKAECVDAKEAPEGYYAVVGGVIASCRLCAFERADCNSVRCQPCDREDGHDVIFKKIPGDVPPLASKKLTIHSNSGNILLCFDGFDLPRISVMNYGDISAQEVAERLLVCWNNCIDESVESIQGGNNGKSK